MSLGLRILLPLAALGSLLACAPEARRPIHLEVWQGQGIVLATHFEVREGAGVEALWRGGGDPPQGTFVNLLQPLPGDPLRARPEGNVSLRLLFLGELLSQATLPNAEFVRGDVTSDAWCLSPATIEQALQFVAD
ncbi:MAG: hypothetical protein ACYTF3_10190 [Planctomycetota bacterium]|jgi:hypothetical protein